MKAEKPPIDHIFVDFENVHKVDVAAITKKGVTLTLLVGAKQKLDASLLESLLVNAETVNFVRLASSGKNALDFILAYYIGRAVAADPTGHFHIISKDTGFDPLIEHLRSKCIQVHRHADFSAFGSPAAQKPATPRAVKTKPAKAVAGEPVKVTVPPQRPTLEELTVEIVEHLFRPSTPPPRKKTGLTSRVKTHLGKRIGDVDPSQIVQKLVQDGRVSINEKGSVEYHRPTEKLSR